MPVGLRLALCNLPEHRYSKQCPPSGDVELRVSHLTLLGMSCLSTLLQSLHTSLIRLGTPVLDSQHLRNMRQIRQPN